LPAHERRRFSRAETGRRVRNRNVSTDSDGAARRGWAESASLPWKNLKGLAEGERLIKARGMDKNAHLINGIGGGKQQRQPAAWRTKRGL